MEQLGVLEPTDEEPDPDSICDVDSGIFLCLLASPLFWHLLRGIFAGV